MSFKTANQREAGGILDREETRNFLFFCPYVFFKPRITRMGQIFDNSIIRDNNRDNREYHEFYVLMSLCLLKPRINAKLGGFLTAKKHEIFCSFVLIPVGGIKRAHT